MGIFSWIILGGLAGWLSSKIMGTDAQMGAIANIVVGIVGAVIGGFIAGNLLGIADVTGLNLSSLVVALLGSVVFLGIVGVVTKRR